MVIQGKRFWSSFWKKEDGIGTLEVMLIIAVIVIIFVIFREFIVDMINKLVGKAEQNIDAYTNLEPKK